MYPILFSIGNVHFYTHGFFVALGILLGAFLVEYLAKKEKLETKNFFDNIVYVILIGLVGARLTYAVLYFNELTSFWQIFAIWQGGMVSYGGFLFGFLAFLYFFRESKDEFIEWLDLGILGLMLGLGIGRIGCFLNGDSGGVASSSFLAIRGFFPTQLLESIWCFILVVFGYVLWRKSKKPGLVFPVILGLYGLGRFLIDFSRQETTVFWHLKSGQIADIVLIVVAFIVYLLFKKGRKNEN